MLTKEDLLAIGKLVDKKVRVIVREEVENEVQAARDSIEVKMTSDRIRVQSDVRGLSDRVKNLDIRVTKNHRELKKEIKQASHFQDTANLDTLARVRKVEDRLGIPAS